MAFNDIKSTGERINALKSIKAQLDQCIRQCQLAQKFYGKETGSDSYGDFDLLWEGIYDRLAIASSAATLAGAELTSLLNDDGFTFRYEWVIGKRNVTKFNFNAAADSCVITATNALVIDAGVVLVAGDAILISGTASNDGTRYVDTGSAGSTIEFTGDIVDEANCTTPGAKLELIARLV